MSLLLGRKGRKFCSSFELVLQVCFCRRSPISVGWNDRLNLYKSPQLTENIVNETRWSSTLLFYYSGPSISPNTGLSKFTRYFYCSSQCLFSETFIRNQENAYQKLILKRRRALQPDKGLVIFQLDRTVFVVMCSTSSKIF